MKNGNKRWIGITILALFPAMMMAQNPDTARRTTYELSVQQAVDYAIKNNVQVKNALIDVLLQKETNRQITAQAYPKISASGNITNNLKLQTTLVPGEFFGQPAGTFAAVTFGTRYITNASADLSQILFDGQVFVGLQARKTSIDWINKNVEVTQEQIKTNVHKIYYQLVVGRLQIQLLDSNLTLLQKQRRDTKIEFDNGLREKLEVDRLDVQLANLETEKLRTLSDINNGYYGLKVLMGMPLANELVLTDTLSDAQIREGILESMTYQYDNRKDFQYLSLTRKLNEFNIRRYKLSKIPTLSFDASYSKMLQRNDLKFSGPWYTASFIALRLRVPIFNGFAVNSQIESARLEVRKLDNQLEALRLDIDADVETARNNLRSAISAMDNQRKNLQLAEDVYRQTRIKYDAGLGSSLELSVAQNDITQARNNYIRSLYDAVIARTDLLTATGKL
jgi:outer membrane protein TolC